MKLVIGLDKKILMKEMRLRHMSFENTLYEMNVNGTKYMVTPRQLQVLTHLLTYSPTHSPTHSLTYSLTHLQVNPLTDEPLGCNFLHYKPGNKLRIPIEFMNTDLNVCIRRGSYIVKINRYLECVCSGLNIPKTIQIDAKDLQDDSLIRLKDVILPPGVSPGTHSLTYSPTHSLTYSLTHSLTYSLTHLTTYSLTHQLKVYHMIMY